MANQIENEINKFKNSPEGQSHAILLEKDIFKKEDEIHPL